MEILGTVLPPVRRGHARSGRAFVAFDVRCAVPDRTFRVTLRGADARKYADVLCPGVEIRLDGEPRIVRYFKANRIRPAVERWRGRIA